MKIDFWCSDMHFNHLKMVEWRDMDCTVEEMNEAVVDAWNSVVPADAVVGVLGDAVMGRREMGLWYLSRLHGDKYFWPGNHDYCWKHSNKFSDEWVEAYSKHMTLMDDGIYEIDGLDQPVAISHFPYHGDHMTDSRYDEYRLQDEGHWILCGHVHHLWRNCDNQTNVGIDAWGHPLRTDEIQAMIDRGPHFEPTPDTNPIP